MWEWPQNDLGRVKESCQWENSHWSCLGINETQTEEKTFLDLRERINRLVALAYPNDLLRTGGIIQSQLAYIFMDALCNKEISRDVIWGTPSKFEQLIELVGESERHWKRIRGRQGQDIEGTWGWSKQSKVRRDPGRTGGQEAHRGHPKNGEEEAHPKRMNWSMRHGFCWSTPERYVLIYWICGYNGHMSNDCHMRWCGYPKGRPGELKNVLVTELLSVQEMAKGHSTRSKRQVVPGKTDE